MRSLNKTLLFGLVFGVLIIAAAIATEIEGSSPRVFFHPVGIMIVFGGTIASALISQPLREIGRVFKRTYFAIRYPRDTFDSTIRELIRVCSGVNKDILFMEKQRGEETKNAMFRDGLALISMGFKADEIRKLMDIKRQTNENSLAQCAVMYFNMAKIGPAFGLLGTLVGLIVLLYYHMGGGNMDKVASSMGVALTATLYGVGLANLVFQPLAEYMQFTAERGAALDEMIVEATVQIRDRRHPILLAQVLKVYMPREDYPEVEAIIREELANPGAKSGPSPDQRVA